MTRQARVFAEAWPLPARARAAHAQCDIVVSNADGESHEGRQWLAAFEMAAVASGNWPRPVGPGPLRWTCFPVALMREHGEGARSVRAAREFTVATCRRWGVVERCEDIAIVVSELLTNAQRHAQPGSGQIRPAEPVQFGLLQPGPGVLCAVADPSPRAPVLKEPDNFAETGRGLQVVRSLSDQWGYTTYTTPTDAGKVVWAMFLTAPGREAPAAARAGRKRGRGLARG